MAHDRGGGLVGLLMLILAPIAATLSSSPCLGRGNTQADATGAKLTGNPYALASALRKLNAYSKRIPMQASPSNAHLFIVAPLLSGVSFANLFSTHPPIAKRIERLTAGQPKWTTSRFAETLGRTARDPRPNSRAGRAQRVGAVLHRRTHPRQSR